MIKKDISIGKLVRDVFDKSFRIGVMIGSVIEIKKPYTLFPSSMNHDITARITMAKDKTLIRAMHTTPTAFDILSNSASKLINGDRPRRDFNTSEGVS